MSIYQDLILDHYRSPRNQGNLSNPTNSVRIYNPLCGDKITMQIIEQEGKVEQIAFQGEGCAISQASASMLTEYVRGKSLDGLRKMDKQTILDMLGVELSPNRLKCALLSWEALMKVIRL